MVDIKLDALILFDHLHRIINDSEGPEPQKVHFKKA